MRMELADEAVRDFLPLALISLLLYLSARQDQAQYTIQQSLTMRLISTHTKGKL